jgi:sRNA-binding protein
MEGPMYPRRNERDQIIEYLAETFPKCFFEAATQRRPLKHDIVDDLEQRTAFDRTKLLHVISWYTSPYACEYNLVAGAGRTDLDGKKCGTVTPLEQSEARRRINVRKKEMRERHAIPIGPPPNKAPAAEKEMNGHTMTPNGSPTPALHPSLTDMQSAIVVGGGFLTEERYASLRPILATTVLKEIIAKAEMLISELQPGPENTPAPPWEAGAPRD